MGLDLLDLDVALHSSARQIQVHLEEAPEGISALSIFRMNTYEMLACNHIRMNTSKVPLKTNGFKYQQNEHFHKKGEGVP